MYGGIALVLGPRGDDRISQYEEMFLPMELRARMAGFFVETRDGSSAALRQWAWGTQYVDQPLFMDVPPWLAGSIELIPGVPYPSYRIAVIAVGMVVGLLLYLLFTRTRMGMQIRAGASNREMAGALGVNIRLLYTLVFGLGTLLAGLAGVMAVPILAV